MHSEIKNIATALLATILIPASYVVLIYGLFKMVSNINLVGVTICLLGIIMAAAGHVLVEQQKQQLTKKQLINKIYSNSIIMATLIITTMVFSHAIS